MTAGFLAHMLQCALEDSRKEKERRWFIVIGASGGDGLRDIEALLVHCPSGSTPSF
jgi:hypothetical protein